MPIPSPCASVSAWPGCLTGLLQLCCKAIICTPSLWLTLCVAANCLFDSVQEHPSLWSAGILGNHLLGRPLLWAAWAMRAQRAQALSSDLCGIGICIGVALALLQQQRNPGCGLLRGHIHLRIRLPKEVHMAV